MCVYARAHSVAATWNLPLVFKMGVVASDESWALQNRPNASQAPTDYRSGLSLSLCLCVCLRVCVCPTACLHAGASSVINILRDGRWGRAPETYGECPHLTGEVAVALNKGLTGFASLNATAREHGDRIKILTNLRHFVAYAGPDSQRFHFNAVVSDDDLRCASTLLSPTKPIAFSPIFNSYIARMFLNKTNTASTYLRVLTLILHATTG